MSDSGDLAAVKHRGPVGRLDRVTDILEGVATVDVGSTAIPIGVTGSNWFRTASTRIALTNLTQNDSASWITAIPASTGSAVDVDTIGLMPGNYKCTMVLAANNDTSGSDALDLRIALSDDSADNDGDGDEAAVFDTDTNHLTAEGDAAATVYPTLTFIFTVANSGLGVDSGAGGTEDAFLGHSLYYFCAALNTGGTAAASFIQGGVSKLVFERLG